ncbi:SNF2-related protein [Halalkalibacter urbisdiaboli]|uniref:SNF2-related protein n=1 Tax=Halalkalibacter urbisdiaboli TaxID=1960589 RepID=UPI0013FD1020|nr:SNF2-related protein [Halalkalibacter urbisdiaboli]
MKEVLLEEGMYVRCPFDNESESDPRAFILGKVIACNEEYDEVKVRFYDHDGLREYLPTLPIELTYSKLAVTRSSIQKSTEVIYFINNVQKKGILLDEVKRKNVPFTYYYIMDQNRPIIVCETDIDASFQLGSINPIYQLLSYEFQNPKWYLNRQVVSKFSNSLENAPIGFETLVGARAYLFPHQIDTIMRASKQNKCRLMLADEVGLGKTIEALIIASTLNRKKTNFKTIVIVPETLMRQWQNEFEIKLWMAATIYDEGDISDLDDVAIIPLERLNNEKYKGILQRKWDLLIVDEVHKVISNNAIYNTIYELSGRVENVLILTATPITARRSEYLHLLKLLKPEMYHNISLTQFGSLVDKNNKIKEHVCEIRNLLEEFYDTSDEDTGLLEDIISELEEINDYVEDDFINSTYDMISEDEPDNAIASIHTLLEYLAEYYQIDRDIIRHRRDELKNKFANRTLLKQSYMMQDANNNYYELETYVCVIELINQLKEKNLADSNIVKELFNRMFSSPFALKSYLELHSPIIDCGPIYNELINKLHQYGEAVHKELEDPDYFLDNPELINSRVTKLLDYLDQEAYDKKVVIFTKYTESAKMLERMLEIYTGSEKFRNFYAGISNKELSQNVYDFQTRQDVNILLCDYTAGEGRNFQIADAIIHFDLPFSPAEIEQRIGRLDRIGRDVEKNVLSVVFYAQDSLEEDLLKIWASAFNIFGESLSGLEIALEEFENIINDYLLNLNNRNFEVILEEFQQKTVALNKILREERLYDANRQMSRRLQRMIENLIHTIDDNQGKNLSDAMNAWGRMVGFNGETVLKNQTPLAKFSPQSFSYGSFKKAHYVPLETEEILKRSNNPNEIIGTYDRDMAIKNEELAFFAPGEPIFDSLLSHASAFYKGTCCAMELTGDFDFSGLVFKWKTSFRTRYLLENDIPLENLNLIKGFNLVKTEADLVRISGNESISVDVIEDLIASRNQSLITHLGRRGGRVSEIDQFIELYPPKKWEKLVIKAHNESLGHVKEKVQKRLETVRKQFSSYYSLENHGHQQSRTFYEDKTVIDTASSDLFKLLVKGILNCKYELDSVYYVRVRKQ